MFYNLQHTIADTQIPGDLFVFPDLKLTHKSGSAAPNNSELSDIEPAIDIFYSYNEGNFLALVEFYLNHDESEFERLQLGWLVQKNTRLWLGRFHYPIGIWSTDFHHGTYLQTTISRPAIIDFEDNNGILPLHISGALLDSEHYYGDSLLNTSIVVGTGSSLPKGSLEPFNLFNPGNESFYETITFRMIYSPQASENHYFGFFVGYSSIEGDQSSLSEIEQIQTGIFTVIQQQALLWRSTIFYIDNNLKSSTNVADLKGGFYSGYVQLEYQFTEKWNSFIRVEDSFNENDDPYLNLFPSFSTQRQLLGIRNDILPQQALTLEWRQDHLSTGTLNQLVLQWSAFLP